MNQHERTLANALEGSYSVIANAERGGSPTVREGLFPY